MTRDEILAMPAGREMDTLVEQHVFGKKIRWMKDEWSDPVPVSGDHGYIIEQYSTDLSAAWEVFELFREKLFSKRKRYMDELQRVISAERGLKNALIVWPDVFWWISPSAICRAALLTTLQDQEAIE